jgi:hypothetical protein
MNTLFIALLVWHVLFLSLHDWVPLGRLTDLAALRSQRSLRARIIASILMGAIAGLALYLNWVESPTPSNGVLLFTLILYSFFLLGAIRAWWLPYLFGIGASEKLVAEYQVMFGNTYTWLPKRHGITVNAIHIVWHFTAVITVVLAALRYAKSM